MNFSLTFLKTTKKPMDILTIGSKGKTKFALIIYIPWAIKSWVEKKYRDEHFQGHSMYWESIEMVRILTGLDYNVDVADCTKSLPIIDWQKYQLIIDERNNLKHAPIILSQKRIHYATGCQWLFHNTAEYKRLLDFRSRTGLSFSAERQVEPIYSEELALYTTYFGGEFQRNLFTYPDRGFQLSLSSSLVPEKKEKRIKISRNNILWLGSKGYIHKGLDIVLEAFKGKKDFNLHICTNLQQEPLFFDWFNKNFSQCPNIFYHGWLEVNEARFQQLAESCIASVYCSAAEGGAGAIIQAMQFGCIPIVNETTALRAQETGFLLEGDTCLELVAAINKTLNYVSSMSDSALSEKSGLVREYANKNHSRYAYSASFTNLIEVVENE
jgi:hypothetical protein